MKKLAIFVEGLTEQRFAERLVTEIAGRNRVRIETRKAFGGSSCSRRLLALEAKGPESSNYYVLIVDSGADNRVKSDVRDHYDSLVQQGYFGIVAVRDVRPEATRADIPRLHRGLRWGIKTRPIEVVFALGIMEVEAWFLAEHSHFGRLPTPVPHHRIVTELGWDPVTTDPESRDHPADDLHQIYRLVGLGYSKRSNQIQRTVDTLCYETLYMEIAARLAGLGALVQAIERFLTDPQTPTAGVN